MWLFRKKKDVTEKVNKVIDGYSELLKEYKLIELKESKLSKNKRDKICAKVFYLIEKGHLKIELK